jgi:hypothetical protein
MKRKRDAALDNMIKYASKLKKPVTSLAAKIIREDRDHGH